MFFSSHVSSVASQCTLRFPLVFLCPFSPSIFNSQLLLLPSEKLEFIVTRAPSITHPSLCLTRGVARDKHAPCALESTWKSLRHGILGQAKKAGAPHIDGVRRSSPVSRPEQSGSLTALLGTEVDGPLERGVRHHLKYGSCATLAGPSSAFPPIDGVNILSLPPPITVILHGARELVL